MADATAYQRGRRDGRAFGICNTGLLCFGQFEGDDDTTAAHEKLRCACGWDPEDFLVGGAALLAKDGTTVNVLWKSGTFQYGRTLKALAKKSDDKMVLVIRDLCSAGVDLEVANAEIAKHIEPLWTQSADEPQFAPLSETIMVILRAAAKAMQEVFAQTFNDVDRLDAYQDAVHVLTGGGVDRADMPAREQQSDSRYRSSKFIEGKEANFSPKGAASALRLPDLVALLERLPTACPGVVELDFDLQAELMTTPEVGAAMAQLIARCPDMTVLGLRETGMTAEALGRLAADIPDSLKVESIRMTGNPSMLSGTGIDGLLALMAKLGSLRQIRLAACGYSGDEAELKQRLKALRPGLRVFI